MNLEDWVAIARLGKVRGNRGEITALALSGKPDRYEQLDEVCLFGDGRKAKVESVWFHDRRLVFKFKDIDTISDAEPLQGMEVRVPRAERITLEPGEFFQDDLLGCQVIEQATGENLGSVSQWHDSGGAGLLETTEGLLIPFAKSICREIDPAGRRILVKLPEGLKELNRQ